MKIHKCESVNLLHKQLATQMQLKTASVLHVLLGLPVKCFKSLSFCLRSLGKTSAKEGAKREKADAERRIVRKIEKGTIKGGVSVFPDYNDFGSRS